MYFITALVFLLDLAASLVVPTHYTRNFPRQEDACHDLAGLYEESCWQALDLNAYLTNWNQTTPICTGSISSNCCQALEPWSTCFLRLARGAADKDCHVIGTGQACSFDKDQIVDISIAPQVHYVLRNIYGILSSSTHQACSEYSLLFLQLSMLSLQAGTPPSYMLPTARSLRSRRSSQSLIRHRSRTFS